MASLSIGNSCIESMVALKDLMQNLNVNNLDCRQEFSSLPFDVEKRSGWLFNPRISGIETMDSLTIIGSNPRFEAPMLEARIRKSWLASNMTIGRIGGDSKLSYPVLELGNKTSVLDELLSGLHDYHDVLHTRLF